MSSFKPHAIAGIVFGLPFVFKMQPISLAVFYLFFALIGASIPDLDHSSHKNKIYLMFIVGILLSVLLFLYEGNTISCLIIVMLALIFYISKHRGFTHTFVGIFIISLLFTLFIMGFLPTVLRMCIDFNVEFSGNVFIFIILGAIGYFTINRRYFRLYLLALAAYLVIFPMDFTVINWYMVFAMMFVGSLSHLVLDLNTKMGLAIFKPFSNTVFHKSMASILILVWLAFAFFQMGVFSII